ncbi:MAG: hypothetical protein D6696_20930, partial [Acidobacteria bacterium]
AYALIAWILVHRLGCLRGDDDDVAAAGRALIDQLMLGRRLETLLRELGIEPQEAVRQVAALKLLVAHQGWYRRLDPERPAAHLVEILLADEEACRVLGVNEFAGATFFDRDGYRELLWWLLATARLELAAAPDAGLLRRVLAVGRALAAAEAPSAYRVDALLAALEPAAGDGPPATAG